MRIVWDLDGVLCNTYKAFNTFVEIERGLTVEDTSGGMFEDRYGITSERIRELFMDFYSERYDLESKPIKMAQDVVNGLSDVHTQYIITARPQVARESTKLWVARYFGLAIDGVFIIHNEHKGELARAIGADMAIDDMPKHCQEYNECGVKSFIYDAPYNIEYRGATRIKTLEEIPMWIEDQGI